MAVIRMAGVGRVVPDGRERAAALVGEIQRALSGDDIAVIADNITGGADRAVYRLLWVTVLFA